MKIIEIKHNEQTWEFEIKEMTAKLAEQIENETTEVFPDGTVQPIGGVGTYKNKKLKLCLNKTHDGKEVTQEYVDALPAPIRNCLIKIISQEEGEVKSFREVPR